MMEGSGSVPVTSGSGSGRPKNIRIGIRNTFRNPTGTVPTVYIFCLNHHAECPSFWRSRQPSRENTNSSKHEISPFSLFGVHFVREHVASLPGLKAAAVVSNLVFRTQRSSDGFSQYPRGRPIREHVKSLPWSTAVIANNTHEILV